MSRAFLRPLVLCSVFGGLTCEPSALQAQDAAADPVFESTMVGIGAAPHSGVVHDLNADGRPDLVTANGPSASVGVLIQTSPGVFADPVLIPVEVNGEGTELISMVGGFFNDDTHLDVAVSDLRHNQVHILIGNGDGTLGPEFTSAETGSQPFMVTTADITGDGNIDLLTANSGGNNITVLAGDGMGGFAPAGENIRVGSRPVAVAAGDFDGDGDQDVAVADEVSADITLLTNQNGTLSDGGLLFVLGRPAFIIAVDVDADDKLDLVMADGQEASLTVFFGDGAGQFGAGNPVPSGSAGFSVTAGDVDLDGFLDLVTANAGTDTVSVVRGLGNRTFDMPLVLETGERSTPRLVLLQDIDGDTDVDMVSCNRTSQELMFFLNTEKTPEPTEVLLRRGDVDGDGAIIITDPTLLLNHLFIGGAPIPCQTAADSDDSGVLDLSDSIGVLNFLFLGGPPPMPPFEECGEDPTEDELTCEAFDAC